eukprot:TRINITY_DN4281_c0_g1_i2.p1 TRINITY_DN4281_c0_g1~~TRINITY_DN4281_c0_g1_i2.p1  ORF type:complete len:619 (+),score=89.40 TRINITY_DN4281_c0_g1_i2:160-2016(+)
MQKMTSVLQAVARLTAVARCLGAALPCRDDENSCLATGNSDDSSLIQTRKIESKASCTAEGNDPYRSGSFVDCCDSLEKCFQEGTWNYLCEEQCSSDPTPTPTPQSTTPPPSPCTAAGDDPYRSGSFVGCCDSLEKCFQEGTWNYLCEEQCSSDPTPTPTPQSTTPPPSPCTAAGGDPYGNGAFLKCCEGLEKCLGVFRGKTAGYKCAQKCSMGTYWPHFDTTPDYLDIAARARGVRSNGGSLSDNFYLVIGDNGGCGGCSECCSTQYQVAAKMKEYVADRKRRNPNSELLFILMVGDNFYWTGAKEGSFSSAWAQVYGPELTTVPWFAVFGNHDYGNDDPSTLCPFFNPRVTCDEQNSDAKVCGGPKPYSTESQSYASNQLNADKGGVDGDVRQNFQMPDLMYYYTIPDLDFELIAMDTNWYDRYGLGGDGMDPGKGAYQMNLACGSSSNARASLASIRDASKQILEERASLADSRNVAIISHYPDEFQQGINWRSQYINNMLSGKADSTRIYNFFGHTHVQECRGTDDSGCVDFLTGGSGGCCGSHDTPAGFVSISWNEAGIQETDCFLEDGCTLNSYNMGTSQNSSENFLDVCAHTNDQPGCPNYHAGTQIADEA